MNWEQYITRTTFYWLSLIVTALFAFYYYWQTVRKNRDIYWFVYEGDEKRFDVGGFCKKIIIQLLIIFFAFFTFFNVIYFCVVGKWVADNSFQSTRSFVIIGAVAYIFDLIEKSISILYEHKQKKIKISKQETKREDKPEQ
jgi:hypothetical protein